MNSIAQQLSFAKAELYTPRTPDQSTSFLSTCCSRAISKDPLTQSLSSNLLLASLGAKFYLSDSQFNCFTIKLWNGDAEVCNNYLQCVLHIHKWAYFPKLSWQSFHLPSLPYAPDHCRGRKVSGGWQFGKCTWQYILDCYVWLTGSLHLFICSS